MTRGAAPEPFEGAGLLAADALAPRPEAAAQRLHRLLDNARYWMAFKLASFEPMLTHAPPAVAELGVGVLLALGESPVGRLEGVDVEAARLRFGELPDDLADATRAGLDLLAKAIAARESLPAREREGFRPVRARSGMSPFALRTPGWAQIVIEGHDARDGLEVPLGAPLRVFATDERGRPLPPPEIGNALGAPVWLVDGRDGGRRVLLAVPGVYVLQVPGRAGGARTLVAR